jgi:hypothetical protein
VAPVKDTFWPTAGRWNGMAGAPTSTVSTEPFRVPVTGPDPRFRFSPESKERVAVESVNVVLGADVDGCAEAETLGEFGTCAGVGAALVGGTGLGAAALVVTEGGGMAAEGAADGAGTADGVGAGSEVGGGFPVGVAGGAAVGGLATASTADGCAAGTTAEVTVTGAAVAGTTGTRQIVAAVEAATRLNSPRRAMLRSVVVTSRLTRRDIGVPSGGSERRTRQESRFYPRTSMVRTTRFSWGCAHPQIVIPNCHTNLGIRMKSH